MLKFLTHKLRTHSLNEENVSEKVGVGSGRRRSRRHQKMAARSARTKERNARGLSRLSRLSRRSESDRMRFAKEPAGVRVAALCSQLVCLLLQVEERDSGTESDDEAERADTGE